MKTKENTKYVNQEEFEDTLNQFISTAIKKWGLNKYGKLSFESGALAEQEGYKNKLWKQADRIRKKLPGRGKGQLCQWLYNTLYMSDNNLLHWREKNYLKDQLERKKADSEKLLDEIFYKCNGREDVLFQEAMQLWGKRFPIVSYIFFLADKDRFLPVKPEIFKERLNSLNVCTKFLNQCSWTNYQEFLSVIAEIQILLNNSHHFSSNVTLLDAHSFVWMLWILNDSDELESVEYDNEGRIKKYYGTTYERSKKNRDKAIKKYGYTCMICGFNFEEIYGERGKGYIEVHHIEPLYTFKGKEKKINPETDLICVCSNCHRMLHRGKLVNPDELRDKMEQNKKAENRSMKKC